jgi:hypothetical protein
VSNTNVSVDNTVSTVVDQSNMPCTPCKIVYLKNLHVTVCQWREYQWNAQPKWIFQNFAVVLLRKFDGKHRCGDYRNELTRVATLFHFACCFNSEKGVLKLVRMFKQIYFFGLLSTFFPQLTSLLR